MGSNTSWRNQIGAEIAGAQRELIDAGGPQTSVASASNSVLKFGKNPDVDTGSDPETVRFMGGTEVYPTANTIDRISSSNAGDNQTVRIIGVEIFAGSGQDVQFRRVRQNVTLNGQTPVALPTPLARVSRVWNLGSTNNAGDVYVFTDGPVTGGVPNTADDVFIMMPFGTNSSFSSLLTVSDGNYLFIDEIGGGVLRQGNANVDFILESRAPGSVFRSRYQFGASNQSGVSDIRMLHPLIVEPNSDVRMRVETTANNTPVYGYFGAYFSKVV